jgi:hypothetical protein
MIGILFFGAIAVWGGIALAIGSNLPRWLRIQRFRLLWAVLFVVLVFFAPVADEIVAYPQLRMLCKDTNGFEFAPGMDAKKAYGRTVYYQEPTSRFEIFPDSVTVLRAEYRYIDSTTKEVIFHEVDYGATRGWLGIPAGSSGSTMTVLIKGCGVDLKSHFSEVKAQFNALNITEIPAP